MKTMLVTNNDKVLDYYKDRSEIIYFEDVSYLEVLFKTRDLIHQGHKLISHPMSGSLKPNQTPFRTIVLENEKSAAKQCIESVLLIESAIEAAQKFLKDKRTPLWNDSVREDFKTVDLSFLQGSIEKFL